MKYRLIILASSALFLGFVFVSGQIFYYTRKTASDIGRSSLVLNSKLTANLDNAVKHKLVLESEEKQFIVESSELKKWTESYTRNYTGKEELRLNTEQIKTYLDSVAQKINTPPVNARLIINDGKAAEFMSPRPGQKLNIQATTFNIANGLARGAPVNNGPNKINLVLDKTDPEVTLEKINKLGIDELLARGESDFGGSPKFRTQNIHVGAQKITGTIVGPGEEFSFNKFLGEVTASTGFVPELVIKSGKLIPEYGGGICQVSTTLFRAAMEAGLPIIERRAHSLPVRYYNPQGYDATIYPGVSDLRFKNDTSAHILIQSKITGSKLYFEIYGTKDGRQIVLDGPYQYEIQANGAMKATISRTVTYTNGQDKKDVFNSSYKSPSLFPTVRNPLE
ncbi:MAG: hypothetical protein A2831_01910 [Candidatus Yanofskybacteria bacterium RIFCSPHIGHO2_01_FULL_44_17]|uniref:YoaR-like putative peptidoglycan binding domain-containing protein n=1 Tax=Candidatus Yanofskybacteria bacterium RIFCSPHIGHO2_01_FULL_44_17 TaxID=1802668 RepID=A0A1F8EV79_9BACT|nr:MAG: hypothetical protein A2831_01910 [Candidatus Yanofskybacteria bacterium RIFCSPHIGHO2_01_FULL_44_17]